MGTGMSTDWLAFLLQTADPLFPTGAYAHSLGLEEAVRLGVVSNEKMLCRFLKQQVIPSLARFELPFVQKAHAAAQHGSTEELLALNAELSAWKLAAESREASLQIGGRRLQMLLKIAATPLLEDFARTCGGRAHHAIVCGIQGVAMPLEAALMAYLYQSLSGYCSAALKLIRIGQDGCQRVLRECLAFAGDLVKACSDASESPGFFNPMLEIASMRHERAFERLFIS